MEKFVIGMAIFAITFMVFGYIWIVRFVIKNRGWRHQIYTLRKHLEAHRLKGEMATSQCSLCGLSMEDIATNCDCPDGEATIANGVCMRCRKPLRKCQPIGGPDGYQKKRTP